MSSFFDFEQEALREKGGVSPKFGFVELEITLGSILEGSALDEVDDESFHFEAQLH